MGISKSQALTLSRFIIFSLISKITTTKILNMSVIYFDSILFSIVAGFVLLYARLSRRKQNTSVLPGATALPGPKGIVHIIGHLKRASYILTAN